MEGLTAFLLFISSSTELISSIHCGFDFFIVNSMYRKYLSRTLTKLTKFVSRYIYNSRRIALFMRARKIGEKTCRSYNCKRVVENKHPRTLYCETCRIARNKSSAAISMKNKRLEEKKKVYYSIFKENDDLLDNLADKILDKMTKNPWTIFLGREDKEGRMGGVILFDKLAGKTKHEKWLNKLLDDQKIREEIKKRIILKEKSEGETT